MEPQNPNVQPQSNRMREALTIGIEQGEQLAGRVIDATRIAYHGIAGAIAEVRQARAGSTMERMEHKQALYQSFADVAQTGETDATHHDQQPEARNFIERRVQKHIAKRQFKNGYKLALRRSTAKTFLDKPGDSFRTLDRTDPHKSGVAVDRAHQQGKINDSERRLLTHVGDLHVDNARLTELKALSQTQILSQEEIQEMVVLERAVNRPAVEQAAAKLDPILIPRHHQEDLARHHRRHLTTAHRLERTLEQPVMSRVRENRRGRAVSRIKRQHHNEQKHDEKIDEIRERRASRTASPRATAARTERSARKARKRQEREAARTTGVV